MSSTHKCEVVAVHPLKHPNADTLSVATLFGGYPCCIRTADWTDGQLGVYIPPDSVVNVTRPEFLFLAPSPLTSTKTKHRVRAKKLRGVQSFGLLLPAPEGAKEGDDLADFFGVEHYEPELRSACSGGDAEAAPTALAQLARYDVDNMRRYAEIFTYGEPVMVTEKIHGANSRYCFLDGRMWCGSRGEWKAKDDNNLWWKALAREPSIERFCRAHPGSVLYGEVYGDVQSLRYGCPKGEVRFVAFDVLVEGTWLDAEDGRYLLDNYCVPKVPLLGILDYDFSELCEMAEGESLIADHLREGIVVKPLVERFHQAIGRVQLKLVSAAYLEKDK